MTTEYRQLCCIMIYGGQSLMENIGFIEMKEEFLPEVTRIYNHYILNSTATFHAGEMSQKDMGEIVFTGNARFKSFVVKADERICGYSILSPFKKREAYDATAEVTVYLDPGYTGKGIGSKAIKHLEEVASEDGFHVLLAVICGENHSSIELFKKLGYEKCAHYKEVGKKFGRWLDVVSYQKII